MKPEEALKNIGDWISEETKKRRYDKITVIELSDSLITLKDALEKQVPKSYDIRCNASGVCYDCPECGVKIDRYDKYCFSCGQRIDWSESE